VSAASRAPRVLFVSHSAAPAGAELKMLEIARRLPSISVLFLSDGPLVAKARADGVPVEVWSLPGSISQVRTDSRAPLALAGALAGSVRLSWRLARAARSYDAVVAFSQKAMVLCALARPLARRPLIWMLNDIITASHFSRTMRAVSVGVANLAATRVVCNSNATAAAFAAAGGDAGRTALVYPGVEPEPFLAASGDARATLGLPPDAIVVGLFGRLAPWKGQHVLVEALAHLPERTHAVFVGGGLFDGDGYGARLRAAATERGLDARTHFVGHRDDVADLMASCDVVVHASTEPEPFGRVVVEGMLAGKPVVATAAGGVPEILDDGVTGRLVPPGDATAMAAAISELIAQPHAAARMAATARDHALRNYTADSAKQSLRGVLEGVLSRPVPSTRDPERAAPAPRVQAPADPT
jgi:glycosyltransferase involved in cell wall biosynthesis